MHKRRAIVAASIVAVAMVVLPALPATAVGGPLTGTKTCSGSVPKIQVQSTATGRINHALGTIVLGSWNNGSTYTHRYSPTNYPGGTWKVFLTGTGGDISYGNAVCWGP